jgi:hypothetical protein
MMLFDVLNTVKDAFGGEVELRIGSIGRFLVGSGVADRNFKVQIVDALAHTVLHYS